MKAMVLVGQGKLELRDIPAAFELLRQRKEIKIVVVMK